MKEALLLSGGMDSTALAYWLRPELAVTVDYGQVSAQGEIRAATAICETLGIEHHVINADLSGLGSGDLAGSPPTYLAPVSEWWPFRNQMLVTIAAMRTVALGARKIIIGTIASDCVHADGKSEFVRKINDLLFFQEGNMTVEAPAINMTSAELYTRSKVTPEIIAWAHSCHKSDYACGMCRGCKKHYETLQQLGLPPY